MPALLSRMGYPAAFALAGASAALAQGAGTWVAAYAAAAGGIAWVLLLEVLIPYRTAWRPSRAGLRVDAVYLVVVQLALPYGLGLGAVAMAAALRADVLPALPALWPHDWPVAVQAGLVLLLAELPHYGLHRLLHRRRRLWPWHAVHHAPERLYALNVARFHPAEQIGHWLVDSVPFVLIGVAPEPLAIAFVFYAVNGFFQHANCDVRLGWLNRIVAGPELHRWHHALTGPPGGVNFGNNLIVWDSLLGTRHLPRDASVGRLGIGGPPMPENLFAQWLWPLRRPRP